MKLEDVDFENLLNGRPLKSDLLFNLRGLTADEYIAKVTDEINSIDIDSVPIDKWDLFAAFSLGALESVADLFICDPGFEYSLNSKDGPVVEWMNKHIHLSKWLKHGGQPLDYQGDGYGGGAHRIMSLLHGSPMAYFSYRKRPSENGNLSTAEKMYNRALIAHDLIIVVLAITCISMGVFIDVKVTDGRIEFVCESTNQYGTPYPSVNVVAALFKYAVHMFADFFSAEGLVIPGFELLTRLPDSKIADFAKTLYDKGMNFRTMTLQACVAFAVDKLMQLYVGIRSLNEGHTEAAVRHKTNKMLLISHGICSAVGVGKAIITEAPWRLNLVVIARTAQLVWRVVDKETELTRDHLLKLDLQILRTRLRLSKTIVLLDELVYEVDDLDQLVEDLKKKVNISIERNDVNHRMLDKVDACLDKILED